MPQALETIGATGYKNESKYRSGSVQDYSAIDPSPKWRRKI